MGLAAVRYLLLLSRRWFSFKDAGIHGFDVLHHQAEQLIAEAEHELRDGEKGRRCDSGRERETPVVTLVLCVGVRVCEPAG